MVDLVPIPGTIRDGGIGYQIQNGLLIAQATGYTAAVDAYGNIAVMTEGTKPTFSAASLGLVPAAAATDIFTLQSVSKTVRLLRLEISGVATAAAAVAVALLKGGVGLADTGGTQASGIALPVAGTHDSANAVATALLAAYTANPTINRGTVGTAGNLLIRAGTLNLSVPAGPASPLVWDFTTRNGQGLVLRAGQHVALNFNGATNAGNIVQINAEFTEE
jgi:hypothetical protein